jgi:acyl carrier protein
MDTTDGTTATLDDVRSLLVETLGIQDRARSLDATTPLLGSLPELDSLAVVELVTAMEERFGLQLDGADLTADAFETLGSLADFVDAHRR